MSKDNTVGSLTEVQRSVIVGCLLGDGYMRKKTNAHLEINHAYSQKDYVDWKYRILKNLVRTPPVRRRGNGKRVAYRFTTRSLPPITEFYDEFYHHERKVIPPNLQISSLSLAVWFRDDGSKTYKTVYFNTQYFDPESQEILQKVLRNRWGIKSSLNKDKKYQRIRVATESAPTLVALIKPFIIPQFTYKLPLNPVSTDSDVTSEEIDAQLELYHTPTPRWPSGVKI